MSAAAKSLAGLLQGLAGLPRDVEVSDLTQDGRAAQPGSAFLAVHGTREHGLKYAPQAVANGARAVLWEPAPEAVVPDLPSQIVVAPVERDASIVVAETPRMPSATSLIATGAA